MGSKVRSFALVFFVFSLLFVVVGNYLSFHVDSHDTEVSYSVSSQNDLIISENHMDHKDDDACISGFCHLGHCSHLILPTKASAPVNAEVAKTFFSKIDQPQQCDLDGPFQPPRAA